MFQFLQVKSHPNKVAPDPDTISLRQLLGDATLPMSVQALVGLPSQVRRRLYRVLIPPALLTRFNINPFTWNDREGSSCVQAVEDGSPGLLNISCRLAEAASDPIFCLELADNAINGVDLNLVQINDPFATRFGIDYDDEGQPTMFGTLRRNLGEEVRAMEAGLSPGQTRPGLRASADVFTHLDAFMALLAHQSIFLEPLTYTSAWIFERQGFAYIRGHKLMEDIQREFQPGGKLHAALDGGSPFRQPGQWTSVRGRAWAIQDGILSAIEARWNDLRMVKQIGRNAGVNTFPAAVF